MLKGRLRDLEMFRVEVQRSHTSTSGQQDLFYSLKMVQFGGEYQVLVANCAWWDHNMCSGNACTDGKCHLHEDNHQPSELAKFQIDFLIFKYMPFACYYVLWGNAVRQLNHAYTLPHILFPDCRILAHLVIHRYYTAQVYVNKTLQLMSTIKKSITSISPF